MTKKMKQGGGDGATVLVTASRSTALPWYHPYFILRGRKGGAKSKSIFATAEDQDTVKGVGKQVIAMYKITHMTSFIKKSLDASDTDSSLIIHPR